MAPGLSAGGGHGLLMAACRSGALFRPGYLAVPRGRLLDGPSHTSSLH
jgi:hypothetical protein